MSYDPIMLLDAYRRMRAIREFEETMRREVQAGTVPGFVHLYCGEEAIAVGACMHLLDTDYIGSTHRGHGHCIAKGCDFEGLLLEIYCKQGGLCNGKGGSMHMADLRKGMLGANAIVGMRYDGSTVETGSSGATEVLCYGTAVLVEPLLAAGPTV